MRNVRLKLAGLVFLVGVLALAIVGILWLLPWTEEWRTERWVETESNQQLAKEACYNTATTPNQLSHLARRTLSEEQLSEAHANLRWDRYDRLRNRVYLAAMDIVMAEEWEWESHWDSEGEDPVEPVEGGTGPNRRGYPANLGDLPFHVEFEFEDSKGETWMVNTSGTATFNCVIEVRANLGSSVEFKVAWTPLVGPDLWLTVEMFDMSRRS